MPKRRASGDGTLRKRADGRWEGRLIVGKKANCLPIYKCFLSKSQKEVLKKMDTYKENSKGIELCENYRMTLAEWLDNWLAEHMKFKIRESTKKKYQRNIEYIKPHLGNKQISTITTADIQKMYNKLKAEGRVRKHQKLGYQLSDNMVRNIHATLHEAMEYAMKEHIILKNPTVGVTLLKASQKEMQVLTEQEIEIFMKAIQNDEIWGDFFYLELLTGLRRGEICALKWIDFDTENGKLTICRTLHDDGTTGNTKTYNSARIIKLPKSASEILKRRKETASSEWIFPNPQNPNQAVSGNSAYYRLKKIVKNCNLPSIRFHDLRHTFATQAVAGGVNPKSLASILGHTKASFSLDRYTHGTSEMQEKAAEIMGNFYEQIIGKEVAQWAEEKEDRAV